MKYIFSYKRGLLALILALSISSIHAQTINVDFRNPIVTPMQICFDVFISQGIGYDGATQPGGEWNAMTITFDIDLATVVPSPPTTTLGSGATVPPATFSNINNTIVDNTNPLAANSAPGGFAAPYNFEYRITVDNAAQDPLPAVPTRAFTICIPVINGTVTADATSDVRLRANTSGAGSFWSNGVLFSQVLNPTDPQDPLPVELTLFEVRTNNCELSLYWETASEKNVGYYQIEASKDGSSFAPIAQQKPVSPNSLEPRAYKSSIPAKYDSYYFRLKAVDLDEMYEYSKIVYAKSPCSKQYEMNLYPNPNYTPELTVEIISPNAHDAVTLQVLDIASKIIRTQRVNLADGLNKLSIETADLPGGTYFIRVVGVKQLEIPLKFIRSTF